MIKFVKAIFSSKLNGNQRDNFYPSSAIATGGPGDPCGVAPVGLAEGMSIMLIRPCFIIPLLVCLIVPRDTVVGNSIWLDNSVRFCRFEVRKLSLFSSA